VTNYTRDLPLVIGDPTQLHQVLLNLCVNGRDAMPKGGTLTLELDEKTVSEAEAALTPDAHPGAYVRLSVIDTGTGIPPEQIDRIFKPFYTTKAEGKGTGLGLSTALGIVRSHGGFLTVESKPGVGTAFHVHLPAAEAELAAEPSELSLESLRGAGEGILLVDDEAEVRQVGSQLLSRYGYRTFVAADGVEGISALAANGAEIRLVITDLMMPVMDGILLVQAAKRLRPDLPFIVASGLAESREHTEQIEALEALGVSAITPKPFTAGVLLQLVKNALKTNGNSAEQHRL
jgi:CheY-like chemotaxis protein